MIAIDTLLISEDLIEKHFVCKLSACKGACCWEGDFGAPVEEGEIGKIQRNLSAFLPFMSEEGRRKLNNAPPVIPSRKPGKYETNLLKDGACVFMNRTGQGIAYCAMEKAYQEKKSDFQKPVSCHLYPVRVTENKTLEMKALNYEHWDICAPACTNGKKTGMKVYEFVKDGLIRKFGQEFYEKLDFIARDNE